MYTPTGKIVNLEQSLLQLDPGVYRKPQISFKLSHFGSKAEAYYNMYH